MTVKLRLRQLLSGPRFARATTKGLFFGKKVDDDAESTTEVSSTSTGVLSSLDDIDMNASASLSSTPFFMMDDPYADVRDQLEALSARDKANGASHSAEPRIPTIIAYTVYLSYAILIMVGHLRDFCAFLFQRGRYIRKQTGIPSDNRATYAALLSSWENFYTRRLYHRIMDVFNRPIASNPGANILVVERVSDDGQKSMKVLGTLSQLNNATQQEQYQQNKHTLTLQCGTVVRRCLNLGSYNYLGFADDWHVTCGKDVKGSLHDYPVSTSSSRTEYGTTHIHRQVETTIARFLKKEDAICMTMGFNTNTTTMPALVSRGDLIISDELNHTSIVNGARASGAAIRIFRHNDVNQLESILRESIIMGMPRTRRPWNKILVVVEGIYSMEGEYCDLRSVVRVTKKYGAYVYLDEAHSIGAMGPTGRGLAEYCGVDTSEIDIMMGTFTKSFGGMGGYIAASKDIITHLRKQAAGSSCHNALSPVVAQQILTSLRVIMGEDGTMIGKHKLQALRDNSNYFRMRLQQMGLEVLGQYDSPIIPVMLYNPTKIAAFSRECFKRGLAVVVVGFPAVPILLSRARFCISAGHNRADLDRALAEIDQIASVLHLRYAQQD